MSSDQGLYDDDELMNEYLVQPSTINLESFPEAESPPAPAASKRTMRGGLPKPPTVSAAAATRETEALATPERRPRGEPPKWSGQRTPTGRRSKSIGGDQTAVVSVKRRKVSPRKSSAQIIPAPKLPNGQFVKVPKGSMMELLQVRDVEIERLMEELRDYEEEATVLTHQIFLENSENRSLKFHTQQLGKQMAAVQRSAMNIKLTHEAGPPLKYYEDFEINIIYEKLVQSVLRFAHAHCARHDSDVHPSLDNDWHPLVEFETKSCYGTFDNFSKSKNHNHRISIKYIDKITHSNPARLDSCFANEYWDMPPAAIIMEILTEEVFNKIRYLIQSEPFWDPVQAALSEDPVIGKDGKPYQRPGAFSWPDITVTPDYLLQQEARSATNDAGRSIFFFFFTFLPKGVTALIVLIVAFEFNCLRAKMLLHLIQQHEGVGQALGNYVERVGVLILNAIWPFFTFDILNEQLVGGVAEADYIGCMDMRIEDLLNDKWPKKNTNEELHKILTTAMQLALSMRADNSVCYIDKGGWNLRYDPIMMENALCLTDRYKKMTAEDKLHHQPGKDGIAWLVVAPMIKRTGQPDGTGYSEARIISKTKVSLK